MAVETIDSIAREVVASLILVMIFVSLLVRYRNPRTPVWAFMAFYSFISVATDLISVDQIVYAVDVEVILFLIGMFSIVSIADSSGLLDLVAWRIMIVPRRVYSLLIMYSLAMGVLSAVAVNDTVAVIGPPIAYAISRATGIDPTVLVLLLAYSITIGSVMTPIGNPQNMLIATESGLRTPLITFLYYLALPTLINLVVTPLIVARLYGLRNNRISIGVVPQELLRHRRNALIGGVSLLVVILVLLVNDIMGALGLYHTRYIGFIPFIVAAGAYLFVERPREIIRNVDWGTIIFFITMFITMRAVWDSGVLYSLLKTMAPLATDNMYMRLLEIELVSILLSQFLSNVPFTKVFIDYINYVRDGVHIAEREWVALAMSSTIAGNLTLLGAASNIIILESLESRYGRTISSLEFMKIGAVVTAVNIVVYNVFLFTL